MIDYTISRQAVIDKINERQRKLIYCFGFENDMVKTMDIAKSIVLAIPPAQSDIIYCEDCKNSEERGCALFCRFWTIYTAHKGFCFKSERREE